MKKLKIGNVALSNPYILAPMAGVTDLPFRLLCKEQGAGLLCMEMVSAKAIQYIKDWFGDAAKIYNENDQIMASFKCNEQAFFYWIMQYAEHFEVISPESSRERIIQCIDNLSKIYKKDKTE